VAQASASHAVVVVEPLVLPAGADAEVGGKPTDVVDAGVDDAAAGEAGRWGVGDTPSDTLEEYYRMELPQHFSSWSPCGRGSHHP
jgi:hypothetical protein